MLRPGPLSGHPLPGTHTLIKSRPVPSVSIIEGQRRDGPANEGPVLRAQEHAAVQADERQPRRFAIGQLDLVVDHVSQRRLNDLPWVVGLLGGPVQERRPESVRHGGDPVVLGASPVIIPRLDTVTQQAGGR